MKTIERIPMSLLLKNTYKSFRDIFRKADRFEITQNFD